MHVFLTGASGYIGSSVLRALLAHGHQVTAVVRSDQKAQAVREAGGQAVVGDLSDTELVRRLAHESDAVVHTASAESVDPDFTATVTEAFSGTSKPFVHTGGIFTFGDSTDISEQSPVDPPELTAWRAPIEARVRASDARTTIVAPGIVYGRGAGIPAMFVGDGEHEVRLVGDGSQRWTTVHVDDLGDLYVLAVQRGEQDGYVVAATGDNPTVREIAEAGAHGSPVVAESAGDSRERLGRTYADALLLHQEASGAHARAAFGWNPTRPTLVEDLASGSSAR
ncbi:MULTISPECIES: NAD-dependent epimerase/dehydratase family protein [unclassified Curtobacterium]|uniref:NAD(P)H-binding protein n=1 Tax=unclassified Curtobacterium TaxID=257496 RepID=UPI001AEA422C|nr:MULTISPECIES: NAD-dependent epimerase/dehydratase family protein [unclassified Curtobacterium]MBP1300882.1 nucleoside-diphosphate-sugar epimerase [Curtobacterium sp. 1310]MCM3520743.1 NAD-dependent epimerase/dehydratase family protein [Curtobacterium sp. P97]